jgi:outer membrane receptor protein involved in Fe transport
LTSQPPPKRRHPWTLLFALIGILGPGPSALLAEPADFDIPAQPADTALLALARQANVEVLFSFDELHRVRSQAFEGRGEPQDAFDRILEGTGFAAKRSGRDRFVVTAAQVRTGSVRGRLLTPGGTPASGIRVVVAGSSASAVTDAAGGFTVARVRAGLREIAATGGGFQPLVIANVRVAADRVVVLDPQRMAEAGDPSRLEPFVVQGSSALSRPLGDEGPPPAPRTAAGDVDLPRSEDDALDFAVFTREQIARSGVVDLNQFLQREILDSDATTLPPEQNGNIPSFASGSTNLNFGGFGANATVVLVDGRRLPEIVTALPPNLTSPSAPQPDVNVIPINMIERVEVLPVSASALYSGSPVGGVINIVLRPDVNTTEVTTTYTNALAGYGAPQSTTSLLNGETLLGGKLHVRLNATFTQVSPPTERDLGYIRANLAAHPEPEDSLFRATPNVTSANGSGLFGPGTASFTSVAQGADGSGGLAAFAGRQGVQSLALWTPPGGALADSPDSLDYPYGRREKDTFLYASATYDAFPWLQLGFDATAGRTVNNTGYSVFNGTLSLPGNSPFNPFGQAVNVTLNETAPSLGESYDEAHVTYYSAVVGLLLRLRHGWEVTGDAQFGLDVTKYRGIDGVDTARWQQLVDQGVYNPLRDTQEFGPPQAFYDQVLEFYGPKGSFATLGDYKTFDSSVRVSNPALPLPAGDASVTLGEDYQFSTLASYVDQLNYGDGSLVAAPDAWIGRSLTQVSVYGEIQAPLLPARWLPRWILGIQTDLAARYTFSDLANGANLAPTGAVRIDLPGGFALRGSYATSNRFPPAFFSRLQTASIATTGSGVVTPTIIYDPLRGNQPEQIEASDATNPNLAPEAAVTQTAGIIFERGKVQRFRASVDFVDTVTSGENAYLDAQQVVDLESLFPQRVARASPAPGDPYPVGPITSVLSGNYNLSWRHSENWNTSLDYAWTECHGGTLEAYCRWIYYQMYKLEVLPSSPVVDELRDPDGATPGILRERANFGVSWSSKAYGFGLDGHYFHSRILPQVEWPAQGSDQVNPYWQFDGFVQADIGRWLPWKSPHYSVRGQLRVNNLFDEGPPKYAEDPSGAGVQSYVDWRGRVYSATVTVTF